MSSIANRRAYLSASHVLGTNMRPTAEMMTAACETLAAVLTDLSDEPVYVIPLSYDDVQILTAHHKKEKHVGPTTTGGSNG